MYRSSRIPNCKSKYKFLDFKKIKTFFEKKNKKKRGYFEN